jgi:hypothetical protein
MVNLAALLAKVGKSTAKCVGTARDGGESTDIDPPNNGNLPFGPRLAWTAGRGAGCVMTG